MLYCVGNCCGFRLGCVLICLVPKQTDLDLVIGVLLDLLDNPKCYLYCNSEFVVNFF